MNKKTICIILAVFSGISLFADVPQRREEVIYSLTLFNGLHYSQTFCREDSDTIYLLENTNNFATIRKTLVYYWPLTGSYYTDTDRLNIVPEGTLEIIQQQKVLKSLNIELYIIYNQPGVSRNNWKVFIGKEADAESVRLEGVMKQYESEYADYRIRQTIYEKAKEKLIAKMQEYSSVKKDTSQLLAQYNALAAPEPPRNPTPEELSVGKQYPISLARGEYQLRFKNKDGIILQGTEKKLIVFSEQRSDRIGYRVVPGDKWTKPERSSSAIEVLYLDATTDIYVIPFFQNEYNDLFYNRMLENDAKGNPAIYRWEEVREIPLSKVEISKNNGSISIKQEEFYAEPLKSSTILGYRIVPYDPAGAHKGRESSFTGFHIPVARNDRSIVFKLQDQNGVYYPSGTREIRVVLQNNAPVFLVIITLVPLILMTVVLILRQRQYSQGRQDAGMRQ